MDLSNQTRNQHFISQIEQRFNAANPEANKERQRIFSFRVNDRDSYRIALENHRGKLISSNLSLDDLFTFDFAPGAKSRFNFETLFRRLEDETKTWTETLLEKLASGDITVGVELVNLFSAKLLNLARNPFSVRKTLNTFGRLADFHPVEPREYRMFERILNGRKPHQTRLCNQLGISDSEYERWLRMLFMLFIDSGENGLSMLESTVKSLFEQKDHEVAVLVCTYSKEKCLLSDRSVSQYVEQHGCLGLEFNLRSDAFVRYLFASHNTLLPNWPPELVTKYLPKKHIQVCSNVDDIDRLRAFNRNAIYQCHSHVFSSVRNGILL